MGKRSWAASMAIHGLLLVPLLVLVQQTSTPAEPLRWEVSLLDAPAPTPAVQTPTPKPPAAKPPPPKPKVEPPPPPKPVPTPVKPLPTPARPIPAAVTPPEPPAHPPTPVEQPAPAPVVEAPVARIVPPPAKSSPAALPAPVAPPPPPRPDHEAQQRWYAALAAKLAELKRYPLAARRLGQEGVVILEAVIQPDGRTEPSVKRSSGYAILDRAAVRLFEDAVQALQERLSPAQTSRLEIPVAYRLEK